MTADRYHWHHNHRTPTLAFRAPAAGESTQRTCRSERSRPLSSLRREQLAVPTRGHGRAFVAGHAWRSRRGSRKAA